MKSCWKDILPVVQIIKLSHEELKGDFLPLPAAWGAPRTLLQVSGTAWAALACLCFADHQEETLDLVLWLLTWQFRNGFNLRYFSGWRGYIISTVLYYAVFHTQPYLFSHIQMYILKFLKKRPYLSHPLSNSFPNLLMPHIVNWVCQRHSSYPILYFCLSLNHLLKNIVFKWIPFTE